MEKLLNEAGLKTVNVDVNFHATFEKHLQENEEICEVCNGLGMTIDDNPFGIRGIKTNKTFPFNNQALSFCSSCYNGVRKRCEHCHELIAKGWTKCNCETVKKQKAIQQDNEDKERWDNIPKISLEQALLNYGMLYVEDFDEYVATDSFEDWIESKRDEEDFNPSELKIYVTTCRSIYLSATDIIENALEDLHEDAGVSNKATEKLQNFLDQWCKENVVETQTYYADESTGVIYSE
ncbi:hypothetical protein [Lysinibacillus sphaericus]|uniref:hypothetical protein n=1 Tax=Lysinibacillus sphaericus TaxID=1421 RepID=UPI000C1970A5|nr:hypothetical protein [Lysinibacillus sphaericus]PIJ98093.1 hypothetical protein CTN02_10150 [Lysinibacillus sphaericus]